MSYSDEWIKAVAAARQHSPDAGTRFAQETRAARRPTHPLPVDHAHQRRLGDIKPCEHSTTWKPWAEMTAEERRKALGKREEKP